MATRWEQITELFKQAAQEVTASSSNWRAFLISSCRNYRLPFDEQLLIYAQRPDATAVLEMERWNQRFGRWVNRGAKGIAVFDRERPHRLRYYFDVADTHETRMSRPVPLWQVRPEYEQDVAESLENSFGELEHREDLGDALLSAARNAVEDNMGDYLGELEQLTQGSLLEELDDDNLTLQFRTLVGNSVAAMLLARCGIDPLDYLEDEDFQEIGNFNTPETRNALGVATRDIARMCLDEIARTVLSLEQQAQKENRTVEDLPAKQYAEAREPENSLERSQHHGSDLHQAGGLFDSQSAAAPGGADAPGQVRPDAEVLFTGAPENHLHQPADQRETEQASGGDPADRPAPDGGTGSADGESSGRDGGTESQRPDAVGGLDEQPAQRGGGNSANGADLQLNTPQNNGDIQRPSQESQQMSLFDFGEVIPAKAYDLGYGHLGNGITVWNRLEEEHGDYKTVAHIAPDRTVTFYDEEMPQAVREEIQRIADTSEMTISATQDAPVFSTLPREREPQLNQDTFSIYQIPSTPEGRDFRFRSHEELESEGLAVDRNNYDLIYTAPLAHGTTLEDIYYTFNADDRPTGFRGHSLSVSDVVVLNRDGEEEAYYCDNYGFTPVPEFLRGIPLETAETSMEPTPAQEETETGSGLEGAEAAPADQIPEPLQRHGEQHLPDTEPYIYCEWSESPVFADKTRYSVGEFDALMRQADAERVAGSQAALEKYGGNWQAWYDADDPENAQYLGYDKVKFTVVMPDGTTYTERQDIGDGDGGVLDFLAKYPKYQDVLPALREAAVRSQPALEEPVTETVPYNYEHEYLLLSRLKADCDYFLGAGGRAEKHLWAGNVSGQIAKMRELYASLPEKPEWLTMEDIDRYESQMAAPVREEEAPAQKEEPLPSQLIPPHRDRITFTTPHPEIPNSERHNFRITDDHLGEGGAKTKFRNNVAAIQTLKQVEAEGRLATPEEQEILSRYVGWGGLPQAFDENNEQWAEEFAQLKTLLSPEEYEAAKATTLNAHYTSPTVIKAIYQAVENMGFHTGNILEPSCGIGNFFGLVPEAMQDSRLYGVELDSLTGRIAQQLYQNASISVKGFEEAELPDSFFDLAIGNVPFGSYTLHDKRYDKYHFLIHDYFFAKTLDKVRPGGIVAFITSKGTLDKQNPSVRKYIAERAELIGAIRLPNNAFLANAGTQVTTDILFLQKREKLVDVSMPEPDLGLEWLHLGRTEDGVPVNQYFLDHPEMILGKMAFDRSMYGNEKETTCQPLEGESLSNLLAKAVENLHTAYTPYEMEEREDEDHSIPADPTVRNFSYTVVDGAVYYRENSRMFPVEVSVTAENRIRGMIFIRDCARSLLEIQMENGSEEAVQAGQQELNRLYDSFTAQYGLLNSRANTSVFSADSSFPLLCSLEILDEQGNLKRKADLFSKRTIQPYRAVTHVDTASEALAVSLGEKARVDLEYMGSLTGKTQEQLAEELRGVIFPVPGEVETNGKPQYATADEYLSGNVREKLRQARAAAEASPTYTTNVEALEKVQPKDLTAGEISVRLGAAWIPVDVAEQFTHELLQTPFYYKSRIRVRYSPVTGEWNVSEKSLDRSSIRVFSTYGTKRVNAYKLIEDTLNLRDVRVFDTVQDENGKDQRVLNKKETAIAQDKQDQIKEKFQEWVWADPTRRERLCILYNEKFNAIRPREYDGSHLVFAGMNPEITLRPHQRNAVARAIYGGNALFAHVVGAGKTYEMIAAAMESKRLGLSSKALFVVPNHIIGDFASDFLDLYPGANILVATKKDFEKQRRKKFCARIATGDYDGIILGHSQFEKIPLSPERQQAMLKKQIAEVVAGIQAAKKLEGSRFTVKQMEKSKKSLEAKLKKLNDQSVKDDVVTFEELGIDRLFIDEADLFKNLYLYTKMRNVGGISQTESLKASDLYMKCQYMDEFTGGKGVVFATGTPVSNSMAELYTMQRYLQGNLLKELGLSHFDAWASQFGETVTSMELKPEGQGFQQKTRFSNFYNLPELMALFKEVADIQTADMLNLPVPKAKYETVVCKPSDIQKEMVEALGQRADAVRSGAVDASQDNMLLITNDGRKLALDQRLLNPLLPDVEGSKVNVCAEKVYRIWKDTQKDRLTQLVFCDLSIPKSDGTFSVYNDLKEKLMTRGIPEEEIAFVHSAANEAQKQQLFGKVRAGQVRVLMGSTAKMGAGTNVQDRLIALHDLDCPWRPRDLEQRSGRIIRQGNQNPEVQIYRYVTEGTFDSYLYQMVENKQRFISQVFTSKAPARVMQEIDDVVLSYNEIKALATGNPQIIERANLETEVNKLKMLRASFLSQKYELEDKVLKFYPQQIQQYEERIAGTAADIARRDKNTPAEGFAPMNVKGIAYTEKAMAGQSLLDACSKLESMKPLHIGAYRGFEMELSYEAFSKEYQVSLKGALSHRVSLGTDVFGNITRLDNALNSLEQRLESSREALERTKEQMETAKAESGKPFPREQELREKSQRLAELTKLLKLDEKDRELLDSAPEEGDDVPTRKAACRER